MNMLLLLGIAAFYQCAVDASVAPSDAPSIVPSAYPTLSPTIPGWVTQYRYSDSSCTNENMVTLNAYKTGVCFEQKNKNGASHDQNGTSYGSELYDCVNGKVHFGYYDDSNCIIPAGYQGGQNSPISQCLNVPFDDDFIDDDAGYKFHDQSWFDWQCHATYEEATAHSMPEVFKIETYDGFNGCNTNVTYATMFLIDYCFFDSIYDHINSSYIYSQSSVTFYNDSLTCSTKGYVTTYVKDYCYPEFTDDQYYEGRFTSDISNYKVTITTLAGIPSMQPSPLPTVVPSAKPTVQPTIVPTGVPSITKTPSHLPSVNPSVNPSVKPSTLPTFAPSTRPTTSNPSPLSSPSSTGPSAPPLGSSNSPSIITSATPSVLATQWVTKYQFSSSKCHQSDLVSVEAQVVGVCVADKNRNGNTVNGQGDSFGSYMYECKDGKAQYVYYSDSYCQTTNGDLMATLNLCNTAAYDDDDDNGIYYKEYDNDHDNRWYDWKCHTSYEDAIMHDLSGGTIQFESFIGNSGCNETERIGTTIIVLDHCFSDIEKYAECDSCPVVTHLYSYIYYNDHYEYFNDTTSCSTDGGVSTYSLGCNAEWPGDKYYDDDYNSDATYYKVTVALGATSSTSKDTGLSTGALIGIIVGAVVGFALLAGILWWYVRSAGHSTRVAATAESETKYMGEVQTQVHSPDKFV